jgi:hypothetical protein
MYHAVHLISSSSDHYNYLIYAESVEDLIAQLKQKCNDFPYIDQVFVTSGPEDTYDVSNALSVLGDAIAEAYELEERDT